MDISEIVGFILGGLGLFFIGVRLIGVNLKMITGRGFKLLLARLTQRPLVSGLMGIVAGSITQSTTAVTFIITGMVSAGLVSTRRVMPMVIGANTGNCVLVFLAVINFHIMILYLLGLVGFLFYCDMDKSKVLRPLVGGLLGISLLFLGLDFIKDGARSLKDFQWVLHALEAAEVSHLLGLTVAGILSFFAQSAATVSAVTIALTSTGVLKLEDTLMLIYGSNIGPALSTWILARRVSGPARQLAIFQVIFKFVALSIMIFLFLLEVYAGIPLVGAFLIKLSSEIKHQLAFAYLSFQIVGAIAMSFLMTPVSRWLEKSYPESEERRLGKLRYLHEGILKDPSTAFDLIEKEQLIVLKRFPVYLNDFREGKQEAAPETVLHLGTALLIKEIEEYIHLLLNKEISHKLVERGLNIKTRMELLINLEETLHEMVTAIQEQSTSTASKELHTFTTNIVEGVDTLLLTTIDVTEKENEEDRVFLMKMTEDRGGFIRNMHKHIHKAHPDLNFKEKETFEIITSRFERLVWMIRYLTRLMERRNP